MKEVDVCICMKVTRFLANIYFNTIVHPREYNSRFCAK